MYYAYARKIPATNTLGARIRVKVQGGSVSCSYDFGASDPFLTAVKSVVGPNATVTFDTKTATGWRYKVKD